MIRRVELEKAIVSSVETGETVKVRRGNTALCVSPGKVRVIEYIYDPEMGELMVKDDYEFEYRYSLRGGVHILGFEELWDEISSITGGASR